MLSAYHEEAQTLYNRGAYGACLNILSDLLRTDENSELWNDWASAQAACERFKEAEAGYRRALELEPEYTTAELNLGCLLFAQGQIARGAQHLGRVFPRLGFDERAGVVEKLSKLQGVPPHLGGHAGTTHLDEGALSWLISAFGISSFVDIGCSLGRMVSLAEAKGLRAIGVDGDPLARLLSGFDDQHFILHDFTAGPLMLPAPIDLGWCVEFLEHVEEQYQPNYMQALAQCSVVFCTAAPPGKFGHHHVNCRDRDYWERCFRAYGFALDAEASTRVRAASTMEREFVRETGLVFVREDASRFLGTRLNGTVDTPADGRELKLDFGCGEAGPKPGFAGVDIRPLPGVQYVCNAWEIEKHVAPNSVTAICSRHCFEHLTFPQAEKTLRAWGRILRKGGTLQIMVPDIRYHIEQFLHPDPSTPSAASASCTVRQHALAGFWGWQAEGENLLWDVHKSGYDYALLVEALQRNGFRDVVRIADQPWNLHVTCRK